MAQSLPMSLVTFKKLFKAFFNLAQCLYTKGLDIKKVSNNFSNVIKSGRLETIYGSQFKDIGKDAAVNVKPKNSFNKSEGEVSNFNFILHVFVFLILKTNSFSIQSILRMRKLPSKIQSPLKYCSTLRV